MRNTATKSESVNWRARVRRRFFLRSALRKDLVIVFFSSRRRFCSSRNFEIWPKIGSSSMQARSMVGIAAALEEAGGRLSTGVAPMLPGTTALLVFIGVGLWRLASLCSSCSSSRCCSSSDMAAGTRDPGASLQRTRTTVGGRHWLEHPHKSVTSF